MRRNKTFYVCLHKSPSGKYYVGITSEYRVQDRWDNGNGYLNSRKTRLRSSIIKYGRDNIKHEVLFTNPDEDTSRRSEAELITPSQIENLREADIGRKKSIEEKEKISKAFSKPAALLDSDGYVIKRYNSATEAAIELDIDISYLNKCCRLLKVYKGYKFVRI